MADQFQTSFIPKKTAETEQRDSFSGAGLSLFIGILTLVISVVLVGGVFAYDAYLNSAAQRKEEQLQQQREAFAPELIREMARLSDKIITAESLLSKHVAVSEIFELLQQTTLKTVRLTSFSFSNTDRGVQVTLQGEGLSFTSVALQADEFSKNPNLSGTVFSGFALNNFGNVAFSATTIVNPNLISYSKGMERRGSASVQEIYNPVVSEEIQGTITVDDGTGNSVGIIENPEDLGTVPPIEELF